MFFVMYVAKYELGLTTLRVLCLSQDKVGSPIRSHGRARPANKVVAVTALPRLQSYMSVHNIHFIASKAQILCSGKIYIKCCRIPNYVIQFGKLRSVRKRIHIN